MIELFLYKNINSKKKAEKQKWLINLINYHYKARA